MKPYFSDTTHANLQQFYIEVGSSGGVSLAFTQAWRDENLPRFNDMSDLLVCVLKDNQDGGAEYETRIVAAYDTGYYSAPDRFWRDIEVVAMGGYFYGQHYCDCHRQSDAEAKGAIDTDDECGDNTRFRIARLYHPDLPRTILYSETMGIAELTDRLTRWGEKE